MTQLERDVMDLLSSQKSVNTTSKLRQSSKFFDVLIKLEDGSHFEAHKFLLAKHSPFFLKLFTYENTHEYHLGNVSCESFANILDWIYKVKWLLDTLPMPNQKSLKHYFYPCTPFLTVQKFLLWFPQFFLVSLVLYNGCSNNSLTSSSTKFRRTLRSY